MRYGGQSDSALGMTDPDVSGTRVTMENGGVPEWLIGAVSKTVVRHWRTVGSNPPPSAMPRPAQQPVTSNKEPAISNR